MQLTANRYRLTTIRNDFTRGVSFFVIGSAEVRRIADAFNARGQAFEVVTL